MDVTSDGLRVVNFFEERKTRLLKTWIVQWEKFVSNLWLKQRTD